MNKKWLFLLLTICFALPAQADIFKCKDGKGKITYQQSPCPHTMAGKVAPQQDPYLADQISAQNRAEQMKRMVRQNEVNEAARREQGAAARNNQRQSALEQEQTIGKRNTKSSPPDRDVGACMADCASEQGICISQCDGNGQCIGNCGAAWGRCAGRCN